MWPGTLKNCGVVQGDSSGLIGTIRHAQSRGVVPSDGGGHTDVARCAHK